MPRLEYFLVAESMSTDSQTGAVSLFNVLSELRVRSLPASIPKFVAVSCWISSKDEISSSAEYQLKIEMTVPGAAEPRIYRGNMTCEVKYHHILLELTGIEVPRAGELTVNLLCDDEKQATHTITVIDATAEGQ